MNTESYNKAIQLSLWELSKEIYLEIFGKTIENKITKN